MLVRKGFWLVLALFLLAPGIEAAMNHVSITSDGEFRYITSNGIPNKSGSFPNSGNPNSISAQSYNFRVPLNPKMAARSLSSGMGTDFGVGIDGIPFDPGTAETWNNDPNWHIEAIVGNSKKLGLDFNNAHVQPTGAYHYHGMPTDLVGSVSPDSFSPIIGWAADGFPIYAQYGYARADDPNSGIKELHSSYRLKSGTRPGSPDGPGGHYDGTYTADFEYIQGYGDLDECNGRFGVTPDYPDGTYYYFITWDFPRVPRCWKGVPDSSFDKSMHTHSNHQQLEQTRPGLDRQNIPPDNNKSDNGQATHDGQTSRLPSEETGGQLGPKGRRPPPPPGRRPPPR